MNLASGLKSKLPISNIFSLIQTGHDAWSNLEKFDVWQALAAHICKVISIYCGRKKQR